MDDRTARELLDRAAADFRMELAQIEGTADSTIRLQDFAGDLNSAGQHPADVGSETLAREIAFGLRADIGAVLVEIEAAQQRLTAGVFGQCETCGQPIHPERLAAVPWTRRCTDDEREHQAWHSPGVDRGSSWPAVSAIAGAAEGDSAWDPEDDRPARSTEERAIHEVADNKETS